MARASELRLRGFFALNRTGPGEFVALRFRAGRCSFGFRPGRSQTSMWRRSPCAFFSFQQCHQYLFADRDGNGEHHDGELAVCAPAPVTRIFGTVSEACFAGSHSPRPPPLAPPAPRWPKPPMAESDFSRPCIIGYGSSPPRCGPAASAKRSDARPPGSRAKNVCTCQGL
jgi:hypothetical protein